jgi:hypothetical protein
MKELSILLCEMNFVAVGDKLGTCFELWKTTLNLSPLWFFSVIDVIESLEAIPMW